MTLLTMNTSGIYSDIRDKNDTAYYKYFRLLLRYNGIKNIHIIYNICTIGNEILLTPKGCRFCEK